MASAKKTKQDRNRQRKLERRAEARESYEASEKESQPVYDRPVEVTDGTFQRLVLDSDVPVVVDFWASWCAPCRSIAPSLEKIAGEMAGTVRVVKYNTEQNRTVQSSLGVRSLPTLVLFKDGKVADTMVGAASQSRLTSWIEGHLAAPRRSLLSRLVGS